MNKQLEEEGYLLLDEALVILAEKSPHIILLGYWTALENTPLCVIQNLFWVNIRTQVLRIDTCTVNQEGKRTVVFQVHKEPNTEGEVWLSPPGGKIDCWQFCKLIFAAGNTAFRIVRPGHEE